MGRRSTRSCSPRPATLTVSTRSSRPEASPGASGGGGRRARDAQRRGDCVSASARAFRRLSRGGPVRAPGCPRRSRPGCRRHGAARLAPRLGGDRPGRGGRRRARAGRAAAPSAAAMEAPPPRSSGRRVLSPGAEARARRLLAAGDAAWNAGRTPWAIELLDEALAGAGVGVLRGHVLNARGHIERHTSMRRPRTRCSSRRRRSSTMSRRSTRPPPGSGRGVRLP